MENNHSRNELDHTKNGTVDTLLLDLVNEANSSDGDYLGITLLVSGIIISGVLVGATTYYRAMSKIFSKDETPKDGSWAKYLLDQANQAEELFQSEEPQNIQMIHLRDAKLYLNERGSIPSTDGVWWRGKIRSVDAFWLGRLRVTED